MPRAYGFPRLGCLPERDRDLTLWFPEVQCPPLPTWNSAVVNTTDREYGTKLNYSCANEYKLPDADDEHGSILHHCTIDGTWDPPIVECGMFFSGIKHPRDKHVIFCCKISI